MERAAFNELSEMMTEKYVEMTVLAVDSEGVVDMETVEIQPQDICHVTTTFAVVSDDIEVDTEENVVLVKEETNDQVTIVKVYSGYHHSITLLIIIILILIVVSSLMVIFYINRKQSFTKLSEKDNMETV